MGGPDLSADRAIELLLTLVAAGCIVAGTRLLLRAGRRMRGAVLVALGFVFAAALYAFSTLTLRLF